MIYRIELIFKEKVRRQWKMWLSHNDTIFFAEIFFEDCEIFAKNFATGDGQLKFWAVISSKISEIPERHEKPANNENSSHYKFDATFVSFIFTLCCKV